MCRQVHLSWSGSADLDFSALSFNQSAALTDVCFFNRTDACGSVMKHSGDRRDGSLAGFDEEIELTLSDNRKISNIKGFAFVVNAHSGESLSRVADAKVTFRDAGSNRVLGERDLLKGDGAGVVIALFWHAGDVWDIAFPNTPSKGRNFEESVSDVQKAIIKVVLAGDNRTSVTNALAQYIMHKEVGTIAYDNSVIKSCMHSTV
jgi:stress response protein SCP2